MVYADSLGRPFLTIEDNGGTDQYETRVALDIEGNALSITDHRGVVVQESVHDNAVVLPVMAYTYDALYRLTQATGREPAGGIADVQRDENDEMRVTHGNGSM